MGCQLDPLSDAAVCVGVEAECPMQLCALVYVLVSVVASLYVIVIIVFMTCTRELKASFSIFLALDQH